MSKKVLTSNEKKDIIFKRLLSFIKLDLPGDKRQAVEIPDIIADKQKKTKHERQIAKTAKTVAKTAKKSTKKKVKKRERDTVVEDEVFTDIIGDIVDEIVENVDAGVNTDAVEEIIDQIMDEPVKKRKVNVSTNAWKDEDKIEIHRLWKEEEQIRKELWNAMIEKEQIEKVKTWKDEESVTHKKTHKTLPKIISQNAWKDEEYDTIQKESMYPENEEGEKIYYPQPHDEFVHNNHLHTFGYKINDKIAELVQYTKSRIVKPPIDLLLDVPDFINVEVEWPRDDPVPANPRDIPSWAKAVMFVGKTHYFYFVNSNNHGNLTWIAPRYPYVDDRNVEHNHSDIGIRLDEKRVSHLGYTDVYSHRIIRDIFTEQYILDGMFYQDGKSVIWTLFQEASNFWIELPRAGEHLNFFQATQMNQQIPQLVKNRIANLSKNKKLKQKLDNGSLSIVTDIEPINSIKPLPFIKDGRMIFIYKEDNTDTVSEQSDNE